MSFSLLLIIKITLTFPFTYKILIIYLLNFFFYLLNFDKILQRFIVNINLFKQIQKNVNELKQITRFFKPM